MDYSIPRRKRGPDKKPRKRRAPSVATQVTSLRIPVKILNALDSLACQHDLSFTWAALKVWREGLKAMGISEATLLPKGRSVATQDRDVV